MNAFTHAMTVANVAAARWGHTTTMSIIEAETMDSTNEQVLVGYNSATRMLTETKRTHAMIAKLIELRDTAKLSVDTWWEQILEVNAPVVADEGCYGPEVRDLFRAMIATPQGDRIDYFYEKLLPDVASLDAVLQMLKESIAHLEGSLKTLSVRRKAAMAAV